jgi:hypothetical protein
VGPRPHRLDQRHVVDRVVSRTTADRRRSGRPDAAVRRAGRHDRRVDRPRPPRPDRRARVPQRRDREEPADRRDVGVRRDHLLAAALPPGIVGGCLHTKAPRSTTAASATRSRAVREDPLHRPAARREKLSTGRGATLLAALKQGRRRSRTSSTAAVVYGEGQKDDPFRGSTLDFALDRRGRVRPHGERVHAALDDACPTARRTSRHRQRRRQHPRTHRGREAARMDVPAAALVDASGLQRRGCTSPPRSTRQTGGSSVSPEGLDRLPALRRHPRRHQWSPTEPRAHRYPGKLASPWYDRDHRQDRRAGRTRIRHRPGGRARRTRLPGVPDRKARRPGRHPVRRGVPIELAWDFGLDTTAIVVLQDAPRELRAIGLLEMGDDHGTTADPGSRRGRRCASSRPLGVEERLLTPLWTRQLQGIGDPSGSGRSTQTGISDVQAYAKQGFSIMPPPAVLTAARRPVDHVGEAAAARRAETAP